MLRKPDFITARAYLADRMTPVETERVSLSEAAGRILAEDLIAADNIPPFDRSPFDGYAFRAADTAQASPEHPVTLTILEEVPAGAVPAKRVTPGTATKILTGAPIPEGADCVSMFERTEFTRETVTLFAPGSAGENIILAGEDVKKGTLLVCKGAVEEMLAVCTQVRDGDNTVALDAAMLARDRRDIENSAATVIPHRFC